MKRPAFTLVELLVYIGISAIAMVIFTNFAVTTSQNAARSKITQELQQNARLSLDRLTQEVRAARQIDSASFNPPLDPGTLILNQNSGPNHTFAVINNALTLDTQPLTSPKVKVDHFILANTVPSVTITLTLSDTLSTPPQSITVSTSLIPHQRLYQ